MYFVFGGGTLGIYLIHPLVQKIKMIKAVNYYLVKIGVDPLISVLIYCLVVMLVSYTFVLILKKIPGIKYLV